MQFLIRFNVRGDKYVHASPLDGTEGKIINPYMNLMTSIISSLNEEMVRFWFLLIFTLVVDFTVEAKHKNCFVHFKIGALRKFVHSLGIMLISEDDPSLSPNHTSAPSEVFRFEVMDMDSCFTAKRTLFHHRLLRLEKFDHATKGCIMHSIWEIYTFKTPNLRRVSYLHTVRIHRVQAFIWECISFGFWLPPKSLMFI